MTRQYQVYECDTAEQMHELVNTMADEGWEVHSFCCRADNLIVMFHRDNVGAVASA